MPEILKGIFRLTVRREGGTQFRMLYPNFISSEFYHAGGVGFSFSNMV